MNGNHSAALKLEFARGIELAQRDRARSFADELQNIAVRLVLAVHMYLHHDGIVFPVGPMRMHKHQIARVITRLHGGALDVQRISVRNAVQIRGTGHGVDDFASHNELARTATTSCGGTPEDVKPLSHSRDYFTPDGCIWQGQSGVRCTA